MAKLFVSYSRKDSVAARKLIEAFRSINQDVWVDWESIPPAVDWLEQIFRGIEEADAFLFLISPDSIASEVCKVEISRAAQNNKRIIPIVLRDVDPKITPESIRKLNWTYIRETDNFEEGLAKVKTAIELDLDWLEEHRRLQVRSLEWHRRKDPSLLLRGRDLRNARHMLQTATSKDPIPTDLQQTFIQHSLRSERNRTIAWAATLVAVVAMAILSYLAVQASNQAQIQRKLAVANAEEATINAIHANQQRQLAEKNAEEANAQKLIADENRKIAEAQRGVARAQIYQSQPGELYTSTLLAIDSWQSIPSEEAEEILRKNISLLPLPVAQGSQLGRINSIEFSPDGNIFVTGSADATACVWNTGNGEKRFCTSGLAPVIDAAFSLDGKFIVTGDQSGVTQVIDTESGNVVSEYRRVTPDENSGSIQIVDIKKEELPEDRFLEIPVQQINISPSNGRLAIAYSDGKIPVLDLLTGKVSSPLEATGSPHVSSFSPNGTWLAAGSDNGVVTIWNLIDRSIISGQKHKGQILAMAFSPNNRILATAGKDNTATITDVRTGKELLRILNENWVRDIAFSPDGSWFVTVSDDQRIRIWDTATGKERLRMLQDSIITKVQVSPNGQWIATISDDRTVRVWNAGTGAEIFQIPQGARGTALAFNQDGRYLISADEHGRLNIWDISVMAAPQKSILFNGIVENVHYSPSGERLVASDENRVWVWTSRQLADLIDRPQGAPVLQFKSTVRDVIFSPDSTLLGVLTQGNEVGIYNIENRGLKMLAVTSTIRSIAFSPDGQQLITSDSGGKVQAWDALKAEGVDNPGNQHIEVSSLTSNGNLLAIGAKDKITILGVNGDGISEEIESLGDNALLLLSDDGSILVSGDSSGRVTIWQDQNGKFTTISSFTKEQAVSLSLNPEGTWLAIGTAKNVYLVESATGKEIARIPHIDIVNGISFSIDGNTLATASSKSLQFWELASIRQIKSDHLVPTACSRLVRNFDTAQWKTLFGAQPYRALCDGLPGPE
jgi:WD40 repeat protein